MQSIQQLFEAQTFENGYDLVNGVAMHAENPGTFQIPPPVVKRHIRVGYFVELRIDSPRFSMHVDDSEKCTCPSCNSEMSKPILKHEHPASLISIPVQSIPVRGWGEDFWVKIADCDGGEFLKGVVDNRLVETRLHGLQHGSDIVFHQDHVLAVHDIHRKELVLGMTAADLKELAQWLNS